MGKPTYLRAVGGEALPALSGEEVLRRAAELTAVFLAANLRRVPRDDPYRGTIQQKAARLNALGAAPVFLGADRRAGTSTASPSLLSGLERRRHLFEHGEDAGGGFAVAFE